MTRIPSITSTVLLARLLIQEAGSKTEKSNTLETRIKSANTASQCMSGQVEVRRIPAMTAEDINPVPRSRKKSGLNTPVDLIVQTIRRPASISNCTSAGAPRTRRTAD